MKDQPSIEADAELQQRREEIQRELRRAQFAGKGALFFTFALAVTALWLARVSYQQSHKAGDAALRAEEALWQSQVSRARELLESDDPGSKAEALDAIAAAARRKGTAELRDTALVALSKTEFGAEEVLREFAPRGEASDPQDPTRLSVSPNFQYVTRSNNDGSVECAQFSDGKLMWELPAQGTPVTGPVVWSQDSEYFAVHHGGRLRVFHLKSAKMALDLACSPAVGPHNPTVFMRPATQIFFWDASGAGVFYEIASGKKIRRLAAFEKLHHAAIHPTRPWLSLVASNVVEIWDTHTGKRVHSLAPHGAKSFFNHHAWRDDGSALAAANEDGDVTIWDTTTLNDSIVRFHVLVGHAQPVLYVAFSHDGSLLASSSRGRETRLWNPYPWTGETLLQTSSGYGVAFGPADNQLALLRPGQGVSLRQVSKSSIIQRLAGPVGCSDPVLDIQFSADGNWIAGGSGDGLFVWNAARNAIVARGFTRDVHSVHFRPKGQEIITCGAAGVLRWRWKPFTSTNGTLLSHLEPATKMAWPDRAKLTRAALNQAETHLLVGAENGRAYVFDLELETAPVVLETGPGVDSLAISPDGTRVALGGSAVNEVRICDAADGKVLQKIPAAGPDVVYSPDGQWLVISEVNAHSFWHTSSNTILKKFTRDAATPAEGCVAFLPDGKTIWNSSFNRARFGALDSAPELVNFSTPGNGKISWLRASPNGKSLAIFAGKTFIYNLPKLENKLSELGLGLSSPLRQPAPVVQDFDASPFAVNRLISMILAGLILAVILGTLTLRYHRRLLVNYFELEGMAARRNEALMRTQADLQQSHKMHALGTLAAGIAHDFNNLLSVINMSNTLTAERTRQDPDIQENVEMVNQSVAQGKAVVRSMLGYSRESVEPKDYSLNEVVRDIASLLRQQFLQGIRLELELDAPIPAILGVRTRLDQILLNLIVNAADALAGKGELRLRVSVATQLPSTLVLQPRTAQTWAVVSVSDNGPGIPVEIRDRIFQPFFTSKNTAARQGAGLGLSMTSSIAQSEGFGIGLETEVGRGTTFQVFIPLS